MTVAPTLAPARTLPVAVLARTTWPGLPFDALRAQYAGAVQAGFIARSLLASARFERALAGLERLVWGPLARRT
jgi:CO dehydrogenase/acetyl-CoA synthase beta subunit